jgi:predicted O-methyltransferase YrrM
LFDWYNEVILNSEGWPSPSVPEKLRTKFLSDNRPVGGMDLGAGRAVVNRKVSNYAKSSLGSKKQLSILYRMVKFQNPAQVLELGTCLGVSTAYLREASPAALTTIEGNEVLSGIAMQNLLDSGYNSINFKTGSFIELISMELKRLSSPWFIYLDGDHTERGTLHYFNLIIEKATQDSILVIDDIYWSKGMERTWKRICDDNRVPLSLDFFHFGVLIFRFNQPKQHFVLKSGMV